MKVDILGLGMLGCLRRAFDLLAEHKGLRLGMATHELQTDCPQTFAMISRADMLGTFQIESRAQMAMLPRMKPTKFYDIVIEVAIVRPGPIQGDMVPLYLKRREGRGKVEYPNEALKEMLEKTLGVPLFQEQAMKVAIVGASFTPARADQLRLLVTGRGTKTRSGLVASPGDGATHPGSPDRDEAGWKSRARSDYHPPFRIGCDPEDVIPIRSHDFH